jgi:glycosidase
MDATSHLYALHENPDITNRDAANIAFLSAFQDHVETISPEAFLVIEAWEPFNVYAPYYASEVSVFNFQGSYWIKDAANGYLNNEIGDALNSLYNTIDNYDVNFVDSIFLSNHDMDRVSIVTDDPDENRLAAEILLTQQSNPFIYYGDEIGIRGTRTNMRWGDYYGSMTVSSADVSVTPMSSQLEDPNYLLTKYIELASVRTNSLALSYGSFIPYDSMFLEGYFRVFEEGNDKELVVVLFNFSNSTTYPIPAEFGAYEILYQTDPSNLGGVSPNSTIVLRLPYDDYISLTE